MKSKLMYLSVAILLLGNNFVEASDYSDNSIETANIDEAARDSQTDDWEVRYTKEFEYKLLESSKLYGKKPEFGDTVSRVNREKLILDRNWKNF